MQNLDQVRAAAAFSAKDDTSKQAVSKLPAMIMTNGLLAAAAFSNEQNDKGQAKRKAMQAAMKAIALHLKNPIHGLTLLAGIAPTDNPVTAVEKLLKGLTGANATSLDLQRATTEALELLTYLKRYTVKEEAEN